jgi:hypothetical protein
LITGWASSAGNPRSGGSGATTAIGTEGRRHSTPSSGAALPLPCGCYRHPVLPFRAAPHQASAAASLPSACTGGVLGFGGLLYPPPSSCGRVSGHLSRGWTWTPAVATPLADGSGSLPIANGHGSSYRRQPVSSLMTSLGSRPLFYLAIGCDTLLLVLGASAGSRRSLCVVLFRCSTPTMLSPSPRRHML